MCAFKILRVLVLAGKYHRRTKIGNTIFRSFRKRYNFSVISLCHTHTQIHTHTCTQIHRLSLVKINHMKSEMEKSEHHTSCVAMETRLSGACGADAGEQPRRRNPARFVYLYAEGQVRFNYNAPRPLVGH